MIMLHNIHLTVRRLVFRQIPEKTFVRWLPGSAHRQHSFAERKTTLIFAAVLWFSSIVGRADLIVDIPNVTLAPGGVTTFDVAISSNASDRLDLFDYQFSIAPVGSPAGLLSFSATQPNTPTVPGYVLSGQSGNFSAVSGGASLTGGDETSNVDLFANFPNITLLGPTLSPVPSLLVRLQIEHDNALATSDEYQISLTSANFLTDVQTDFFGSIVSSTPIAFSSNTATVLVSSAAVPEPSSVILLTMAACVCLGFQAYRRRRIAGTNCTCDDSRL